MYTCGSNTRELNIERVYLLTSRLYDEHKIFLWTFSAGSFNGSQCIDWFDDGNVYSSLILVVYELSTEHIGFPNSFHFVCGSINKECVGMYMWVLYECDVFLPTV